MTPSILRPEQYSANKGAGHDDRAEYSQDNVSDDVRHGNAEHGRLAVGDLAASHYGSAERQRNGADLHAQETREQSHRDASSEEGDVGTIARAQDLPHLGCGAFNVAGAADQRHDVADIDPGIRTQRNFSAHPRERAQEY